MEENFIYHKRSCITKNGCDLSEDFGIPDYINDIRKIVHCNYILKANEPYENESDVVFDGEVLFELLLLCEDDSVRSVVFSRDYSLKLQSGDTPIEELSYNITLENNNSRLLSARKLSLRTRVCVDLCSEKSLKLSPSISGTNAQSGEVFLEKKTQYNNASRLFSIRENSLISTMEVELSSQMPEIDTVVYSSVKPNITQIAFHEDKILLRGDCYLHILYQSDSGEYYSFSRILDFSEFVNCRTDNTSMAIANIEVVDIKLSAQTNNFGENKNIVIDYTYNISVDGFSDEKIGAVTDIYSTVYNTQLTYNAIEYLLGLCSINTSFSYNNTHPISEKADRVIDSYGEISDIDISYDEQRGRLVVEATVNTDILTETDSDNDRVNVFHIKVPIKYEKEIPRSNNELSYDYNMSLLNCDVVISDKSFDVNYEISLSVNVMQNNTLTYVENCTINDKIINDASPLTIYYPKETDDLWSVAKKYKCTCDDIISVNNLENEAINEQKVILIPKTERKLAFEKSI